MHVLVLPEARMRADNEPEHRNVLEKFRHAIGGVNTMGELVAFPQMQRVVHPMFKWKIKGHDSRLIFRVASSPATSTLYAVVHGLVFHGSEYDNLEVSPWSRPDRIAEREELGGLAEFAAQLDSASTRPAQVPLDYIGLRKPPMPLQLEETGLVLEESEDWVEKVLSNVNSMDARTDWRALELLVGPVINRVVMRETDIVSVNGSEVLVEETDGTTRLSLGNEEQGRPRRRIPVPTGPHAREFLLRAESASAGQVDPFLLWHPDQEEMLFRFARDPHALPAFIDGPGGSGKTAILMWLVRGVLASIGEYHNGTKVRFVTLSRVLAEKFATGLRNHLELVEGRETAEAGRISREVCTTIDNYLLDFVRGDEQGRFAGRDRKIDWRRFHRWFTELHPARRPDLTPHEGWCALRSMILGDTLERDEPRFERSPVEFDDYIRGWFSLLRQERQQGLALRHMDQALRLHRYYREWKTEEGLWDESDLLSAACSGLPESSSGADLLVVDEAQDLTPDILRFMVRSSAANRFRLDLQLEESGRPVSLPILLAADDLQTINPSGFTWKLAQSLFYSETAHILNSNVGVVVDSSGLETNFRMRKLVNDVASALRTWVRPEVAQSAHRSVRRSGYSGPCMTDDESSIRKMLHSVSRIIIPREIEMYDENSSLLTFLARYQIDPDQVLHVTAAKGDEFSTVALVGFAEYARNAVEGSDQEAQFARQLTYVASSRARDVAVWCEPSTEDLEWFWQSDESGSPGTVLPRVESFSMTCLDPFRETPEQIRSFEVAVLNSLCRDGDRNDLDRVAAAAVAVGRLRSLEDEALIGSAESLLAYFRGDRASFRVAELAGEFSLAAMEMVATDGYWEAFAGPHTGEESLDFLGGAAVLALRGGNFGLFAGVMTRFAGEDPASEILGAVRSGLVAHGRIVVDALQTASDNGNPDPFGHFRDEMAETTGRFCGIGDFPLKLRCWRQWASREVVETLRTCAKLAAAGSAEESERVNRKVVMWATGAPWAVPALVRTVDAAEGLPDEAVLRNLDESCTALCAESQVSARFVSEIRADSTKFTDEQLARFLSVVMTRQAELVETAMKES